MKVRIHMPTRRQAIVAYVRAMEADLPADCSDDFVMTHWGPLKRLLGVKSMKVQT